MQAKRIITFLKDVAANNNRPWFQEHKGEYDAVRKDFEEGVQLAIGRIAEFDSSIAHLAVKDCTYRFYRDTRFSPDKSPYKHHLGAYISARGKKSLHGGYYIHLEPGHCLLAIGSYWLPTNILTSCRNEIMGNIDDWRAIVESRKFVNFFGKPGVGSWDDEKGFGLESLKSAPSGFPRDYEFVEYLRMKDYCCWKSVPDTFFEGDRWFDEMVKVFKVGKPMMDFVNNVIDDYE
ncbi:MAG: DUF2461 domain-containing protein [Prevotella sp.]|nr:DUF2461 domain-containing protein [Prevotella sp.]